MLNPSRLLALLVVLPTILTVLLARFPFAGAVRTMTTTEVAKHNVNGDIYVIIQSKVYDLSQYANIHPGGYREIAEWGGKDATRAFYGEEDHMEHGIGAKDLAAFYVADIGATNSAPPAVSACKQITLAEVQTHTSPTSLWFILGTQVLDMTQFASAHPGGPSSIVRWGGQDATAAFGSWSVHNSVSKSMLSQYYVGDYCSVTPCPTSCANGQSTTSTAPTPTPTPVSTTPTPGGSTYTPPSGTTGPPATPTPGGTTMSLAQVAMHNTEASLWIIIRGKIYDMTQYRTAHPGGPFAILRWGGRDCTAAFDRIGLHSTVTDKTLATYYVGDVGAAANRPPGAPIAPVLLGAGTTGATTSLNVVMRKPQFKGDTAITSCNLQYRTGGSTGAWSNVPGFPHASNLSVDHVSLTPGTTYDYRSSCTNSLAGEWSPIASFTTLAGAVATPPAPTNPTSAAASTKSAVFLQWNPSTLTGDQLLNYIVYRTVDAANGGTPGTGSGAVEVCRTIMPACNITQQLSPNTPYNFTIKTVTLGGESALSQIFTVATQGYTNYCGPNCNGNGRCDLGRCVCNKGFIGQHCEIGQVGESCLAPDFCVGSTVSNGYVYVSMTGTTRGYVSLIVGSSDGMTGGDCWVGWFSDVDGVHLEDRWSPDLNTPYIDRSATGKTDLELLSGWRSSSQTSVMFRRKIDTGDVDDIVIPDAQIALAYAFGATNAFTVHRTADRATGFNINFFTGVVTKVNRGHDFYWPVLVCFIIFAIFGLCLRTFAIRQSKFGSWLKQSQISMILKLVDLTVEQALFCLIYIAGMLAVYFIGEKVYRDAQRDPLYACGKLLEVSIGATLLPISRNSIWLPLMGISFERAVRFHRWAGTATIAILFAHTWTMVDKYDVNKMKENLELAEGAGVVYGTIAGVLYTVMFLFALPPIRRRFFECFYFVHILCFPPALIMSYYHTYEFALTISIPLALYLVDRVIRFFHPMFYGRVHVLEQRYIAPSPGCSDDERIMRSAVDAAAGTGGDAPPPPPPPPPASSSSSSSSSSKNDTAIDTRYGAGGGQCTTFTLQINHFTFREGDYVFLWIPQASLTEWHPFSISSAPGVQGTPFTLHMLSMGPGSFTQKVCDMAKEGKKMSVYVDGPYGRPSIQVHDYPYVCLIAGGVGVTPMLSTAGQLLNHTLTSHRVSLRHCHLVWCVKSIGPVRDWAPQLLRRIAQNAKHFSLHIYVTRADTLDMEGCTEVINNDASAQDVAGNRHDLQFPHPTHVLPFRENSEARVEIAIADNLRIGGSKNKVGVEDHEELLTEQEMQPLTKNLDNGGQGRSSSVQYETHMNSISKHNIYITAGRPDIRKIISIIAHKASRTDAKGCVMACGPQPLVDCAQNEARRAQFDFHKETFLL